jgi:hypothetical protein
LTVPKTGLHSTAIFAEEAKELLTWLIGQFLDDYFAAVSDSGNRIALTSQLGEPSL